MATSRRSEVELAAERAKMRAALKADFIKQVYNPYRFINGNQPVFDPAIQRYISMKASQYEFFKPTPKTSFIGLVQLAPIVLFYLVMSTSKTKREEGYRAGKVAYRDRRPKFI